MKFNRKIILVFLILGGFLFFSREIYAAVFVHGYFRKNGTYVSPYIRRDPTPSGLSNSNYSAPAYSTSYNPTYIPIPYTVAPKNFCGAGQMFATQQEATDSLNNAYNDSRKDLMGKINDLTNKNSEFQKELRNDQIILDYVFGIVIILGIYGIYKLIKKLDKKSK